MRTAFVLNMGANGLGVARSLGALGIQVVGMDFDPRPPGFRSKYVKAIRCPDPLVDPQGLLEFLSGEGAKLDDKGVMFPCTDAFLNFVSRNRARLSDHYELTLPPEKVIEGLVDKRFQYEWAERLGIPMTQTFFPKDLVEAREIKDVLRYPAFIKGRASHLWARRFGNKGFTVMNAEELECGFRQAFDAGLEALVQKIMMPPGENILAVGAYLGRNGYSTPALTWSKIRQSPPNFGIGSCLETLKSPELGELGLRFMKGIGHLGPAALGFKLDMDDGIWKFVEMNGRFWFQNNLATRCGYNLPLLQYLDSQGEMLPPLGEFEEGICWWDAMADFDSFVRLKRQNRQGASAWIRSFMVPDVYAYYERGDIMPMLDQARYGLAWAKEVGNLLKSKRDEDAKWASQRDPTGFDLR
jgi:predicted ATP-grasp superfamily ATP-dependent carboligase